MAERGMKESAVGENKQPLTRTQYGLSGTEWAMRDDMKILGHCSLSVSLCVQSGTISKFP